MNITDEKGNEINISFPQERVGHYLIRVGANNLQELSFDQRKKIFLLSVNDFIDGTMFLEEMSALALEISIHPTENDSAEISELHNALDACSELAFYVRKIPEVEEKTGNFVDFMTEVKNYYNKYYPF